MNVAVDERGPGVNWPTATASRSCALVSNRRGRERKSFLRGGLGVGRIVAWGGGLALKRVLPFSLSKQIFQHHDPSRETTGDEQQDDLMDKERRHERGEIHP